MPSVSPDRGALGLCLATAILLGASSPSSAQTACAATTNGGYCWANVNTTPYTAGGSGTGGFAGGQPTAPWDHESHPFDAGGDLNNVTMGSAVSPNLGPNDFSFEVDSSPWAPPVDAQATTAMDIAAGAAADSDGAENALEEQVAYQSQVADDGAVAGMSFEIDLSDGYSHTTSRLPEDLESATGASSVGQGLAETESGSDPVDAGSGEYRESWTDLLIPGVGMGMHFQRTYRSHLDFHSPLGWGWDHSWNQHLVRDVTSCGRSTLTWHTGMGAAVRFVQEGHGWTTPGGADYRIIEHPGHKELGNVVELIAPEGISRFFDAEGPLLRIQDLNQNAIDFVWKTSPTWDVTMTDWSAVTFQRQLIEVTDTVGRTFALDYDGAGHLRALRHDATGFVVEYDVNADGDLVWMKSADGEKWSFKYDGGHSGESYLPTDALTQACTAACTTPEGACGKQSYCEQVAELWQPQCMVDCGGACGESCQGYCENACQGECAPLCLDASECPVICDEPHFRAMCENLTPPAGDNLEDMCDSGCGNACEAQCGSECDFRVYLMVAGNEDGVEADASATAMILANLETFIWGGATAGAFAWELGVCLTTGTCDWDASTHAAWRLCNNDCMACCLSGGWACGGGDTCMGSRPGANCSTDCEHTFLHGDDYLSPTCGGDYDSDPDNGCIAMGMQACEDACTTGVAGCHQGCADVCSDDCASACNAECGGTCEDACRTDDLEAACDEQCVASCVEENGHPSGNKTYGNPRDLNHNLTEIRNARGEVVLQNTYGADIFHASFDRVVAQDFGAISSTYSYLDLQLPAGSLAGQPGAAHVDLRFDAVELCPLSEPLCPGAPGGADERWIELISGEWAVIDLDPTGPRSKQPAPIDGDIRIVGQPPHTLDLFELTADGDLVRMDPPLQVSAAGFVLTGPNGSVELHPTAVPGILVASDAKTFDAITGGTLTATWTARGWQGHVGKLSSIAALSATGGCRSVFAVTGAPGAYRVTPADACRGELRSTELTRRWNGGVAYSPLVHPLGDVTAEVRHSDGALRLQPPTQSALDPQRPIDLRKTLTGLGWSPGVPSPDALDLGKALETIKHHQTAVFGLVRVAVVTIEDALASKQFAQQLLDAEAARAVAGAHDQSTAKAFASVYGTIAKTRASLRSSKNEVAVATLKTAVYGLSKVTSSKAWGGAIKDALTTVDNARKALAKAKEGNAYKALAPISSQIQALAEHKSLLAAKSDRDAVSAAVSAAKNTLSKVQSSVSSAAYDVGLSSTAAAVDLATLADQAVNTYDVGDASKSLLGTLRDARDQLIALERTLKDSRGSFGSLVSRLGSAPNFEPTSEGEWWVSSWLGTVPYPGGLIDDYQCVALRPYEDPIEYDGAHPSQRGTLATVITDGDGQKSVYYADSRGRVVRVVNADQGRRDLNWDDAGRLLGFRTRFGDRRCWKRDAGGKPIVETWLPAVDKWAPQDRREWVLEWGPNARVLRVISPQPTTGTTAGAAATRINEWDETGNLVRITEGDTAVTEIKYDAAGRPVWVLLPDGRIVELSYDAKSGQWDEVQLDTGGSPLVYTQELDGFGRPSHSVGPRGDVDETKWRFDGRPHSRLLSDVQGNHWVGLDFDYDEVGDQVSVTRTGDGLEEITQSLRYNGRGLVTRIEATSTAGNRSTCVRYDAVGRPVEIVLPRGNRRRFVLSGAGRIESVEAGYWQPSDHSWEQGCDQGAQLNPVTEKLLEVAYAPNGRATQIRNGGLTQWNRYDGFGQLLEARLSTGESSRFLRDGVGRTEWIARAYVPISGDLVWLPNPNDPDLASLQRRRFDPRDRMIERMDYRWVDAAAGRTWLGTGESKQTWSYDDAQGRIDYLAPTGELTTTWHDSIHGLVQVDLPTGDTRVDDNLSPFKIRQWRTAPTPSGGVEEIKTLDHRGLPISFELGGRKIMTVERDALGRVIELDRDSERQSIAYTPFGEIEAIERIGTDQSFSYVRLAHDDNGLLEKQYDASDALTAFHYDQLDRLVATEFPDGTRETLSYHADTLLPASRIERDGSELQFGYDELGDLARVWDGSHIDAGVPSREYVREQGQIVVARASGRATEPGDDHELRFTYDSTGALVQEWSSRFDKPVSFGRDAGGAMTSLDIAASAMSWTRDGLGRTMSVAVDGAPLVNVDYAGFGSASTMSWANGITESWTFDDELRPRLGELTHSTQKLVGVDFGWTHEGLLGRLDLTTAATGQRSSLFGRDAFGRLNAESHGVEGLGSMPSGTLSIAQIQLSNGNWWEARSLDADGNWTVVEQSSGLSWSASVGADHRYLEFGGTVSTDLRGNTTQLTDPDRGPQSYSYDELGQMQEAQGWRFEYDAFGRLIAWTQPGQTRTELQYAAGDIVRARDDDGDHIYVPSDGAVPVGYVSAGETFAVHRGWADRVAALTDQTGALVERYEYSAFGSPRFFGGNGAQLSGSMVRFALLQSGQPYFDALRLQRFGARWYRPSWGRFLTPDPAGFIDGPNRYAFVGNQPLLYGDPSGLWRASLLEVGATLAGYGVRNLQYAVHDPTMLALPGMAGGALVLRQLVPAPQTALDEDDGSDFWDRINPAGQTIASGYTAMHATGFERGLHGADTVRGVQNTIETGLGIKALGQLSTSLPRTLRSAAARAGGAADDAAPALSRGADDAPKMTTAAPSLHMGEDRLLQYAANVPTTSGGFLNVVTHADARSAWVLRGGNKWVEVDHRSLARYIRGLREFNGQPVRLIACNAGACPTGLGQNLANKLGVNVQAAKSPVVVSENGSFGALIWRIFTPGN